MIAIHATALVYRESAILIRGPSGAGKSSLALALLETARDRNCFAALIGDDRVFIVVQSGRLTALCVANIDGLIERRGYGIVARHAVKAGVIRLVVDFPPRTEHLPRVGRVEEKTTEISGVRAPHLVLSGAASALERAYAVIEELDRTTRSPLGAIANFA
jgi:HPr kinase/phosphorylase